MKLPFGKSKPKSATELAQEQRSSNSNSMRKDLSVDNKKKKIIIIAGIVIAVLLVAGGGRSLFVGDDKVDLSDSYVAQKETKTTTPPPPLTEKESKFDTAKLEELSKKVETETNTESTNDSMDSMNNDSPLDNVSFGEMEKKPSDMYEYLTRNQARFEFQKQHLAFIFDGQRYLIGEKFKGWWLIEDITPNYVRFYDRDADYAYNLRFLK